MGKNRAAAPPLPPLPHRIQAVSQSSMRCKKHSDCAEAGCSADDGSIDTMTGLPYPGGSPAPRPGTRKKPPANNVSPLASLAFYLCYLYYESFSRKIQVFNNSVGYASNETGNNLIVKEQWLEKPSWRVYILENESEEYQKIKDYLINKKCEYIPYIGKNDHFADIINVAIEKAAKISEVITKIDSLYDEKIANIKDNLFEEILGFEKAEDRKNFLYKEVLPVSLNEKIGYDVYKEFVYTNRELEVKDNSNIYKVNEKNIYYF